MPTFTKNNVALSITPEEAEHLTSASMDNLSRFFDRLQESGAANPQPPAQQPTDVQQTPPGASEPVRSASQRTIRSKQEHTRSEPVSELPPGADPLDRAKAILGNARPGHQIVFAYVASKHRTTTPEIVSATRKAQSDISRAMSSLRDAEKQAGLAEGDLIQGKRDSSSKIFYWTAGPMLLHVYPSDGANGPV